MTKMTKVIVIGTILAAIGYILAGMFGYAAFAAGEDEVAMAKVFGYGNILQAPYRIPDSDKRLHGHLSQAFEHLAQVCQRARTVRVLESDPHAWKPVLA